MKDKYELPMDAETANKACELLAWKVEQLEAKIAKMQPVVDYLPKYKQHSACGYTHVEKEMNKRLAAYLTPNAGDRRP